MIKEIRQARRLLGAVVVLVLVSTHTATVSMAQVTVTGPASTALAGGGPAFVYGSEALFRNPANLVLDAEGSTEVSVGGAGVSAGGSLLQFQYYNDLFTRGTTLTDTEARAVVG